MFSLISLQKFLSLTVRLRIVYSTNVGLISLQKNWPKLKIISALLIFGPITYSSESPFSKGETLVCVGQMTTDQLDLFLIPVQHVWDQFIPVQHVRD